MHLNSSRREAVSHLDTLNSQTIPDYWMYDWTVVVKDGAWFQSWICVKKVKFV